MNGKKSRIILLWATCLLLAQAAYMPITAQAAVVQQADAYEEDALTHVQWGLVAIKHTQALAYLSGRDMHPVKVAVIDSGVDMKHLDLDKRLDTAHAISFQPGSPSVSDNNGHGTHVAGIIGATVGNGLGIHGVAGFPWISILPVKVVDNLGNGTTDKIARAIDYAIEQQADIINLSIGGVSGEDKVLQDAVHRALKQNIVVVVASGNENVKIQTVSPANMPQVITVGAVDKDKKRAAFSNYGTGLDLVAPGVEVISTYPAELYPVGYAYMDGTSMAAPFVTGVTALMKSVYPSLTPAQVQEILTQTTEDLGEQGWDEEFGYGLLRADKAVKRTLDLQNNLPREVPEQDQPSQGELVFPDVPARHWAYAAIRYTVQQGMFQGFPDGRFGPSEALTRAQVATVIVRDLGLSAEVPRFKDVDPGHWAAGAIGALQKAQIMVGEQGYFRPEARMTRAELSKVLVVAYWLGGTTPTQTFTDVSSNQWYYPYVVAASQQGIIQGMPDGTFQPTRQVTRAEAAVMFERLYH